MHSYRLNLIGASMCMPVALVATLAEPAFAQSRAAVADTFTFRGAGWGHGVGMSQYGAYGMATEGYSAVQIVQHYFAQTQAGAVADGSDIRINIGHRLRKASLQPIAVEAGGGTISLRLDGKPAVLVRAPEFLVLRAVGGKVSVAAKMRTRKGRRLGSASRVLVQWGGTRSPGLAGGRATKLKIAKGSGGFGFQSQYRYGIIDVAPVKGRLEVVNKLRIHDEYLFGIAEVDADWPTAALQAQAIAARSYALAHVGPNRRSCRCQSDDGYGGYYDQTFWGYGRELSYHGKRWRDAVRATSMSPTTGRTLTYQGDPIPAFYFAGSGGRTENSEDVWGGTLPWARSVDDHWSVDKRYNPSLSRAWTYVRSQSAVAAVFGLPNVKSIKITARYAGGSVKTAVATSNSGKTSTLVGTSMASRLGLMSNWVKTVS